MRLKLCQIILKPYDTTVNFISQEEFNKNHQTMPHGGFVIKVVLVVQS